MNVRQPNSVQRAHSIIQLSVIVCCSLAIVLLAITAPAQAAIGWDAEANTHWWFDPVNWRDVQPGPTYINGNNRLPPYDQNAAPGPTDTDISIGTGAWDQGLGVLFDPANDPNAAAATSLPFPTDFGPLPSPAQPDSWRINQLYISRSENPPSAVPANKLTIRGNLTAGGNVIIGRSSGVSLTATDGTIVQESGTFIAEQVMDLGANEQGTSNRLGYGNGTYDYRSGTLQISTVGGAGLRLSNGGSGGPGGIGRFIMHNPSSPGHVRAFDVVVAGSTGSSSTFLADGVNTGVGVFEFHFENGGVRPVQVNRNLSINNGKISATSNSIRSARLDLVLHEAPTVIDGKPQDLGLFDVAFSEAAGVLGGTGDLRGDGTFNNDRVFSSADGSRPFYSSSDWAAVKTSPNFSGLQDEDFLVTAVFGNILYRWEASYSGEITWVPGQENNSVIQSIVGSVAGGKDVVLVGHSIVSLGLTGDFNNDGTVDAADYVLWRKTGGDAGPYNYADWFSNFGAMAAGSGGGSGALTVVPEPGTFVFMFIGLIGLATMHRKQ